MMTKISSSAATIRTLCCAGFALCVFAASAHAQMDAPGPGGAQAASDPAGAEHDTMLGFTPWPSDLTERAVARTYDFISAHANLIAHHLDSGVPWQEALAGTDFPGHLKTDWDGRTRRTPADISVFLALTPLSFERDSLALAWTNAGDNQPLTGAWAGKRFDDRRVKSAYLNYVRRAIDHFGPRYLAIGIESNIMITKSPESWNDYLDLHAHVYQALKREHPDLPIFATVQYEHLRGIEDESKPNAWLQIHAVRRLMKHSDLMALSTYRYGKLHPNPMTADYFDLAESFGRPVAIAETGAMSAPVRIFGLRLPASPVDQVAFLSGVLSHAASNNYPFVINWVAIDFDPMIRRLPKPLDEIAKAWVHTGMQTARGRNKPALAVWDGYLATSVPPP